MDTIPIRSNPTGKERTGNGQVSRCGHGAVVIEYEPLRSFHGTDGRQLHHAQGQAEEYTDLLSEEEGRTKTEYTSIAWDGSHTAFGHWDGSFYVWEPVEPFGSLAAQSLLTASCVKTVDL